MRIETSYIKRKSLRSFRVWLAHAGRMNTFTAGPMIFLRFCGLNVNIYPWFERHQRAKRANTTMYDPKQFRRR